MILQHTMVVKKLPHPLPTHVSEDQIAFLDLETDSFGRRNSPIRYLGLLYPEQDGWYARQWIPENSGEEHLMLKEVLDEISRFRCLVHYNGTSFDLPILEKRMARFDLSLDLSQTESIDLYRCFSPLKKLLSLSHFDQRTLEQFLGLSRYPVSGNDLIMLPSLLSLFSYVDLLQGNFTVQKAFLKGEDTPIPTLSIQARLEQAVPNPFSLHTDQAYATAEKDSLRLLLYGIRDTLKYFYPDYRNYYYLPEEDTAIHKSVSDFVDKNHRIPAKAATCYTKKYGSFFPQSDPLIKPAFVKNYKDKLWYFLCDEKTINDSQTLKNLVVCTLNHL